MSLMSVEYEIPGYSDSYVTIRSRKSVADVDLALVSMDIDTYRYGRRRYNTGNWSLESIGSREFNEDIRHWSASVLEHVSEGEIVFIMLNSIESFLVMTGSVSSKGSTTTYGTETRSNKEVLPTSVQGIGNLQGENIILNDKAPSYFKIPDTLREHFRYEVSFDNNSEITPVYFTKNKSKLVGGYQKVGKGFIVWLPAISYDNEKFTTTDTKGKTIWTKEALKFGESFVAFLEAIKQNLVHSSEMTPAPEWAQSIEYQTKREQEARKKLAANKLKIEKLKSMNDNLQDVLTEECVLKGLLYETGKPLEAAVTIALKVLGYQAENYDDGKLELDQVIISPEGERFIGECEGKDSKAINVTKFRQLNDSLAADFERDEVEEKAKGIIFGNPSRLVPVQDRTEWFTAKATSGAAREGVVLIKTPDLYAVAKYVQDSGDIDFAKKCREAITAGGGQIAIFPDVPEVSQK